MTNEEIFSTVSEAIQSNHAFGEPRSPPPQNLSINAWYGKDTIMISDIEHQTLKITELDTPVCLVLQDGQPLALVDVECEALQAGGDRITGITIGEIVQQFARALETIPDSAGTIRYVSVGPIAEHALWASGYTLRFYPFEDPKPLTGVEYFRRLLPKVTPILNAYRKRVVGEGG